MIRLKNIHKSFGAQVIMNGADLVLNAGEKIGLIGLNGAGKTTLLRIIEGVEEVDSGTVARQGRLRVGTLRQEMETSNRPILTETLRGDPELLPLREERERIQTQLSAPCEKDQQQKLSARWGEVDHRLEEIGTYQAESRAGAILMGLGFSQESLNRPMHTFSGGWRMRVALAQLLFSQPDILLLDEPTNHLDLESVAWFENHLRKFPCAFMAVSHDRGFLNRVTRVTVELEKGCLSRFSGSFDRYIEQKAASLQQRENLIASQAKQIENISRFINRFRSQATKARQVQSRVKKLAKIETLEKIHPVSALPKIRLPEPKQSALEMITVRKLTKNFGSTRVLSGVDFNFQRGEKIGLLGANGAGKTTFLKLMARALAPDRGEIILGDRVRTAYFTQHSLDSLDPKRTVLAEAVAAAPQTMRETEIRNLLGGFLFSGDRVFKLVSVLSGGERARLALLKMFLSGANLLLLDEPTNHLDMEARTALGEALENYRGSFLLVTHDRDLMEIVCNRYCVVANNTVQPHEGSLASYLEQVTLLRNNAAVLEKLTRDTGQPNRGKKRQATQIREQLQNDTRSQRQRARELETRIQQLESERKKLDLSLADPDLYQESVKDKLKKTLEKNRQVTEDLEKIMAEWETISLAIEEREAGARTELNSL